MSRIPINLPVLGVDQPTGRLAAWLRRADAVAEIETEKVTVEMESPAAGTIVELLAEAGTEVTVGEPIAWLDDGP